MGEFPGRLELFIPVPQGFRVVHARDQIVLLRTSDICLVGIEGRLRNQPWSVRDGVLEWEGSQEVFLVVGLL